MSVPLRSHASVRSYYFREAIARRSPHLVDRYTLDDFRYLWMHADVAAREWMRQATNRYNHATSQWEQGQ